MDAEDGAVMLQCPVCREYAAVALPPDRLTTDPATHGCSLCSFKFRSFFVESKTAEWFQQQLAAAKIAGTRH